jgi:hypothetical protein
MWRVDGGQDEPIDRRGLSRVHTLSRMQGNATHDRNEPNRRERAANQSGNSVDIA